MNSYSIILLAAGSSSRFGSPKQLAHRNGKSLVQHATSEAIKTSCDVTVVLGANYDTVKKEIDNFPLHIEYNNDWKEGMSSSIRSGLSAALSKNSSAEAIIIAVCDQPYLSAEIIEKLIEKYEEKGKPIVACSYGDTIGTPVLFDKIFFPALLDLKGQSGAKKIISENADLTETVSFPAGSVDIDTQQDYEKFLKS
jgi:molybdenum cofactor cytidylyltransferase